MVEKLTDEEHQARAMLLGMSYHHGRGDPVYFEIGADEKQGMEIWPRNPNGLDLKKVEVDGVFFT